MKNRILTAFASILITSSIYAQAPQKMSYQAVVRNATDVLVSNTTVGIQISILQTSAAGTAVFIERHTPTTNANGLATLEIGAGTVVSGDFSTIDWAAGPYFIKTETDPNGGTAYSISGTAQLLSVPYALYAESTAGSSFSGDYNDLTNTPSNVSTFTNDAGYITSPNDADSDPTNEIQSLSLAGQDLTISGGNTVTLPTGGSFSGDYNDLTNTPTNVSTFTNDAGYITSPNDADSDPTNEIQSLTLVGQNLSISGGNMVTLPAGSGGTLDQAYDFGGAGAGRLITADAGAVEITSATPSAITLRSAHTNSGVAILTETTSAANTFSTVQSSTNSNSTIASAIIGNSSGAAWGVSGQVLNTATAQAAVYGSNLRTNGGHGVYGIGVNGVVGETNYSQGMAIYGENFDAIAPLGNGIGTAGRGYYGIVGEDMYAGAVGGAYGVLSNGDLGATGVKTFIIDHPSDPENKNLRHFSAESNEVLNIYRGNAVFDANGEAIIELPDYYDAINKNPSYNLTPVGGYAQLYIKEEISEGKFVIGGGTAGLKVSWTIYAERNDAYLQQHPEKRAVEVDKREGQKGRYFMPELYDQPAEKAIFERSEKTKVEQSEMQLKR